jgi:hypothetical protein
LLVRSADTPVCFIGRLASFAGPLISFARSFVSRTRPLAASASGDVDPQPFPQ